MSQQQPWWQRAAQWQLPWQIPTPEAAHPWLEWAGDAIIPGAATGRAMAEGNMGPGTMAMGALDFLPTAGLMGRGLRGLSGAAGKAFSNLGDAMPLGAIPRVMPGMFPNRWLAPYGMMSRTRSGLQGQGFDYTNPFMQEGSQRMVVGAIPAGTTGATTPRLFGTNVSGTDWRPIDYFRPARTMPGGTAGNPIRGEFGELTEPISRFTNVPQSPFIDPRLQRSPRQNAWSFEDAQVMQQLNRAFPNVQAAQGATRSGIVPTATPQEFNRMVGIGGRRNVLPNPKDISDKTTRALGDAALMAVPTAVKAAPAARGVERRRQEEWETNPSNWVNY